MERARAFKKRAIKEVEARLNSDIHVPSFQYEYDAIVSIVYNCRSYGGTNEIIRKINTGHYDKMFNYILTYRVGTNKGFGVGDMGKLVCLWQESTMHHTKSRLACFVALAFVSGLVAAKTNPECLKHLGGGYSDAQCYHGLSTDLTADNKHLYGSVRKTIPAGNMHAELLHQYMTAQDQGVKYCELQRNAGAMWKTEHDGSMFPAIYEQCVYDLRKEQNKFLKDLLEMANWK